jgi:hypothetical protein
MSPHPESCFVFHFSGHGLLAMHDAETAYLMVHDSDPAAPSCRGIEMRRLVYELMPLVRVAHSVVTLDACHSGFAAGLKEVVPVCRWPRSCCGSHRARRHSTPCAPARKAGPAWIRGCGRGALERVDRLGQRSEVEISHAQRPGESATRLYQPPCGLWRHARLSTENR